MKNITLIGGDRPDFDYELIRDEEGVLKSFTILFRTDVQLVPEEYDCDCCRRKGLYANAVFDFLGFKCTLAFIPADYFDIEAFSYLFYDSVFLKIGYRFECDSSNGFLLKDLYSCLLADNGKIQVEIKPLNSFTEHNLNFVLHRQYSFPYLTDLIERETGYKLGKAGDRA